MNTNKKNARIAGLLYLIMAITGPVGLMIVPSKIVVAGDALATAQNMLNHEMLFRIGILSNLICQISFIFLVLAIHRLYKGVNAWHAKLMVSLVIAAVPIAILIELLQLAAYHMVSGASYLQAIDPGSLNSLALFLLNLHEQGVFIAGIFWGLWLFPFGYLTLKSGFMPRILGWLLIIGCFAYLIDSTTALLVPDLRMALSGFLMIPLAIGEISMILWLLIKGVKDQKPILLAV